MLTSYHNITELTIKTLRQLIGINLFCLKPLYLLNSYHSSPDDNNKTIYIKIIFFCYLCHLPMPWGCPQDLTHMYLYSGKYYRTNVSIASNKLISCLIPLNQYKNRGIFGKHFFLLFPDTWLITGRLSLANHSLQNISS